MNITHSQKKMGETALKEFRDRFNIPISDDQIGAAPFYKPPAEGEEMKYLHKCREALGGPLPARNRQAPPLATPELEIFQPLLEGSGDKEMSTTMALVRIMTLIIRDKEIGKYLVPIVPDEARTFGMEGMFRQLGIYSSVGQLYEPVDSDQLLYYREDKKGQVLEEGITEAGAMSSWIAAATAYANHGQSMIPFYIFYSMFGFQRIGDLAWAAGDMRARGFLIGGTAGRTTLAGEGLQHQDGHSLVVASTIPNCISYDPAFAYEMAVIVHDGMHRMYGKQENCFYYITAMNETYVQPAMPEGAQEGILKGMYRIRESKAQGPRVQLLGSGAILRETLAAADLLEQDFGAAADVWSATSFNELRREGMDVERWNMLHPEQEPRQSYVEQKLGPTGGPIVAATDYIQTLADQIRPFVPRRFRVLGTDGFGRSDVRSQLRKFFEVNRYYIALAALKALAEEGEVSAERVSEVIKKYRIDPEKPNPAGV
jgi:pyruvate dehydrogenase E1 component